MFCSWPVLYFRAISRVYLLNVWICLLLFLDSFLLLILVLLKASASVLWQRIQMHWSHFCSTSQQDFIGEARIPLAISNKIHSTWASCRLTATTPETTLCWEGGQSREGFNSFNFQSSAVLLHEHPRAWFLFQSQVYQLHISGCKLYCKIVTCSLG